MDPEISASCYLGLRISQVGIVAEAYLKSQGKRECQEGGIVERERMEDSELRSGDRKRSVIR